MEQEGDMNITKNPRLKHRAEVDMAVKLSDINVNHRCRLWNIICEMDKELT